MVAIAYLRKMSQRPHGAMMAAQESDQSQLDPHQPSHERQGMVFQIP